MGLNEEIVMRAIHLASLMAEELIRTEGVATDVPDQFLFSAEEMADEHLQDCVEHLKWQGLCVVFEQEEEHLVMLGDFAMESLS